MERLGLDGRVDVWSPSDNNYFEGIPGRRKIAHPRTIARTQGCALQQIDEQQYVEVL